MKSFMIGTLYYALLALPAIASGTHDHGHEQKKDTAHVSSESSHHPTDEPEHEHIESTGTVGFPAQPSAAQSSVLVSLTDQMRINFSQDMSSIKSGAVIQFLVTNEGKIPHEFSIGNQAEQRQHAEMMRKMPGMFHADGNTVTVEPGATKSLTWHFEGSDTVVFACNIPGHYEVGMFHNTNLNP